MSLEEELGRLGLQAAALELAVGHARLLVEWSRRINLTTVVEPREVATKHFAESFAAAELFGPDVGPRVLDVGGGGGFPGLAARIVRPDVRLTVLEPRAKRAAFLSRVAALHPEPRPRVHSVALEAFHVERPFDVVAFRAVHLRARQIQRVLASNGRIVAFPGGRERWSQDLERAGFLRIAHRRLPTGGEVVAWARKEPDDARLSL